MRKALDGLYGAALAGACLAMAAIAVLVFIQVTGRVIDRLASWAGLDRVGFSVPSLAEIGGFLFVAAAFLALPYTLRSAGHVRVTLALRFLGPAGDRIATGIVLVVAFCLMVFAGWHVGAQTYASFERGSVSYGLIPIALWIPQAIMSLGIVIFAVAILDEFVSVVTGGEAAFRMAERARADEEPGS